MTKNTGLFNRIQGWLQKYLTLGAKPSDSTQSASNKSKQLKASEDSNHQQNITPDSTKPSHLNTPPFILGLDNIKDLGTLTNNNFQKLIRWNWLGKNGSSKIEMPVREDFSTEALLSSISWDFEPTHEPERVTVSSHIIPIAPPFILGLDDIPNLEQIVNQDFLNFINWEVNPQIGLPVDIADYSLLDDLLETFPE